MAFNDLQQKALSEYAVFAAHKNLAKLSLFTHTFTELNGRPGESIAVPVYDLSASGAFVAGTNDYGTGVNEVGGLLINLDQHLVKSVSITDAQLAYTGINWVRDTGAALAERITRDINGYVFGLINATNVEKTATLDVGSLSALASLGNVAESNDIPADRCIIALDPENFYKVLAMVPYQTVGDPDYIKTGVVKNLFGFKGVVCTSNLPSGTKGAIILDEAMGVASKYLAPMTPGAYPEAWAITGDDGFTLGARRFMDLSTGSDKFAMDALFGAKLLQPTKVVRLV